MPAPSQPAPDSRPTDPLAAAIASTTGRLRDIIALMTARAEALRDSL